MLNINVHHLKITGAIIYIIHYFIFHMIFYHNLFITIYFITIYLNPKIKEYDKMRLLKNA